MRKTHSSSYSLSALASVILACIIGSAPITAMLTLQTSVQGAIL